MASIAIMVGGAVLNAGTFTGGNYLARALGGDSSQAKPDEKKRQDKAVEAYQAAYNKYSRNRTQLLDWIETNAEIHAQAKQNFTNTDYAFKLYNQAHPGKTIAPLKEPKFSDFYQPSPQQKNSELLFLGAGTLAVGYAAFCFRRGSEELKHLSFLKYGRQVRQDLLQPRRLLERPRRDKKVGRGRQSL